MCPLVGALGAPARRGCGRASSRGPAKSWQKLACVCGGGGWGVCALVVGVSLASWAGGCCCGGLGGGDTSVLVSKIFGFFKPPPARPPLRH